MSHEYGHLEQLLRVFRTTFGRRQGVMHNFAERVSIASNSLVLAQAANYRNLPTSQRCDMQLRDKHLDGYHVCVGENGHWLYVGDTDRD